jgi:hypothetical protein
MSSIRVQLSSVLKRETGQRSAMTLPDHAQIATFWNSALASGGWLRFSLAN